MNVAILIFPHVQIMDFAAPYEVFGQAGFNVFTVASSKIPLTSAMGLQVTPEYTLADHPTPDIIVVPGGREFDEPLNPGELEWMRKYGAEFEHVLSTCCGSIEIGRAGLLEGLSATTHHGYYKELQLHAPGVCVVENKRWVDNGRIVTSGGLCSGIDGALHVVAKVKGEKEAMRIADWMEYTWTDTPDR